MLVKIITVFLVCCCSINLSYAQTRGGCSTLGQTPATAFPLCTKDTFVQTTVPTCVNQQVIVPGCPKSTGDYADKNPFWYRFTCYQAGKLAFVITPNDLNDDYDWQLYDITNVSDLNRVYTQSSLFVVGNWSGSSGLTGAGLKGKNGVECASSPSDNISTFSIMPVLQLNHTYLLLVSHYSDGQSGYKLSFGGGTAVINDPRMPDLQSVKPSCNSSELTVKLTTRVKCSSLSADGSDFMISPASATVVAATGGNCNASFDMDSITLTLSNPLPAGSYNLLMKTGKDANTLLDDCDRNIPDGKSLPFSITPIQPAIPDSLEKLNCAPDSLSIVFTKNIQCGSISPDGSDFVITGPAPVTVKSAAGICDKNNLSPRIILTLTAPLVTGGNYTVQLKNGTDGNTLIDECQQQTPVGASVSFSIKDTVSANFTSRIAYGCVYDTVSFAHDGQHGVNQWQWRFGTAGASDQQSKTVVFNTFGDKQITLKVSNGFCTSTVTKTIALNNTLKAIFETNEFVCPEDAAVFKNSSIGNILSYQWNFADGNTSTQQTPAPETFPKTGAEKVYPVQLVVENDLHCFDTAVSKIKVLRSCYIAVPNAFTPNADGLNDYLYPLNAFKADALDFSVYNRLGQQVFHSEEWTKKWDGTVNGHPQSSGAYVWILRYVDHDSGKKVFLKGTTLLIR